MLKHIPVRVHHHNVNALCVRLVSSRLQGKDQADGVLWAVVLQSDSTLPTVDRVLWAVVLQSDSTLPTVDRVLWAVVLQSDSTLSTVDRVL